MRRQRLPAFFLLTAGCAALVIALDKDSVIWTGFAISVICISLIVLRDVDDALIEHARCDLQKKTPRN